MFVCLFVCSCEPARTASSSSNDASTEEEEVFFGDVTNKERRKATKFDRRKTALFVPDFRTDRKMMRYTMEPSNLGQVTEDVSEQDEDDSEWEIIEEKHSPEKDECRRGYANESCTNGSLAENEHLSFSIAETKSSVSDSGDDTLSSLSSDVFDNRDAMLAMCETIKPENVTGSISNGIHELDNVEQNGNLNGEIMCEVVENESVNGVDIGVKEENVMMCENGKVSTETCNINREVENGKQNEKHDDELSENKKPENVKQSGNLNDKDTKCENSESEKQEKNGIFRRVEATNELPSSSENTNSEINASPKGLEKSGIIFSSKIGKAETIVSPSTSRNVMNEGGSTPNMKCQSFIHSPSNSKLETANMINNDLKLNTSEMFAAKLESSLESPALKETHEKLEPLFENPALKEAQEKLESLLESPALKETQDKLESSLESPVLKETQEKLESLLESPALKETQDKLESLLESPALKETQDKLESLLESPALKEKQVLHLESPITNICESGGKKESTNDIVVQKSHIRENKMIKVDITQRVPDTPETVARAVKGDVTKRVPGTPETPTTPLSAMLALGSPSVVFTETNFSPTLVFNQTEKTPIVAKYREVVKDTPSLAVAGERELVVPSTDGISTFAYDTPSPPQASAARPTHLNFNNNSRLVSESGSESDSPIVIGKRQATKCSTNGNVSIYLKGLDQNETMEILEVGKMEESPLENSDESFVSKAMKRSLLSPGSLSNDSFEMLEYSLSGDSGKYSCQSASSNNGSHGNHGNQNNGNEGYQNNVIHGDQDIVNNGIHGDTTDTPPNNADEIGDKMPVYRDGTPRFPRRLPAGIDPQIFGTPPVFDLNGREASPQSDDSSSGKLVTWPQLYLLVYMIIHNLHR